MVFRPGETVHLYTDTLGHYMNMDPARVETFRGSRALRGSKLPKAFRGIERVEVGPEE